MVRDADQVLEAYLASDPKMRAEWDSLQKLKNDPRVTPVGAFLRATSLDELPQLFNVLRGDMSYFGPRPFLPSQSAMYLSAGGEAYFNMHPGISGAWQVSARNEATFVERVEYDEIYYRDMSLKTDLVLLWKTYVVMLQRKGK